MKTQQFKLDENLFSIDGHYYAVNKDANIEDKDWYLTVNKNIYKSKGKMKDLVKDLSTVRQELSIGYFQKIIFSTDQSLEELPLLVFSDKEDETKTIMNKWVGALSKSGFTPEQIDKITEDNSFYYIEGYKANPAKFTEEDMEQIYDMGRYSIIDKDIDNTFDSSIERIKQSKTKQIKEFEIEMEEEDQYLSENEHCKWQPKLNSLGQIKAINVKYN